jgi:hypothetical protein
MKFLDAILGRSKPVPAKLDALFALPSAAVTLQAEAGFVGTGQAGVCFKPVSAASFDQMQGDMSELLGMLSTQHEIDLKELDDKLGYHWVVISNPEIEALVTDVHMVNSTLQEQGYDPQLLCSVFGFRSEPTSPRNQHFDLIYLFKRGSFYPFAPLDGEKRDNELELHLKGILAKDLNVEADLARWFPVWGAPVA